jgi:alpha-tubulin suppressor-like RCC1 family protein
MISEIACKLKNSLAINKKNELYSWGCYKSGLLGIDELSDSKVPTKVEIKAFGEEYLVNSISLGHSHAAAICSLKDYSQLACIFNQDENKMIEDLKNWFTNTFIWEINDVKSFVQTFLRLDSFFTNLKFKKFKKRLLYSFINYMKINNNEFFNMRTFFETNLKAILQIIGDDSDFTIEKWDILFPSDLKKSSISKEQKYIENFKNFITDCQIHFSINRKDIAFFIRLVTNFERNINKKHLYKILKYVEVKGSKKLHKEKKNIIKDLSEKIFDEIANKYLSKQKNQNVSKKEIPVIYIIDIFNEGNDGEGILFTWGVNVDGRLGYKNKKSEEKENTIDEEINEKNNIRENEYIMDSNFIQNIPKIVKFLDNIFVKKVACGYNHTLALTSNKVIYSWGNGKYGCLGNSNSESNFTPKIILFDIEKISLKDIKFIGAGMYYSVATDGRNIYTWGCGNNGRLGHGDEYSLSYPKRIKFFEEKDLSIKFFSCGDTHTLAIDDDDYCYSWGSGTYGKLGHGNNLDYNVPKKIDSLRNSKIDIVSCGSNDSMVVTSDLKIYVFGKNTGGFLGTTLPPDKNIIIPCMMNIFIEDPKLGINEASMGSIHLLIKFSNGDLLTMGSSLNGISGIPGMKDRIKIPTKIPNFQCNVYGEKENDYKAKIKGFETGFKIASKTTNSKILIKFVYVSCSQNNSAFLLQNGDVFMSGNKSLIFQNDIEINSLEKTTSGENFSTPNGDSKTGGNNKEFSNNDAVKLIRLPFSQKVGYIAIAKYHAILISEFRAYSWGNNDTGVLGIGDRKGNITKPLLIEKLPNNVSMAACSDTHSMVLTMNGEIYSFGLNTYGKLGIGSISKYTDFMNNENGGENNKIDLPIEYEPKLVKDIEFAYYIVCGNNHSGCIMKSTNENLDSEINNLYLWGSGYDGKLGNSKIQDMDVPHLAGKESINFIQASLGDEFTLALDSEGFLYGAGKTDFLGMDSKERQFDLKLTTLTKIHNEKKYNFISSSSNYSLLIDNEGKMFGFGKIFKEKLELVLEKEEIQSVDRMKLVACGQNHFVSISKAANDIYSWGSNSFFKCGQDLNSELNFESIRFFPVPKKIKKLNFKISSGIVTEDDLKEQVLHIQNEEADDNIPEKSPEEENETLNNEDDDETNGNTISGENENKEEKNKDIEKDNSDNLKKELDSKKLNEEKFKKSHDARRLVIQGKLLQEKEQNKTEGIMEEDMRVISNFYNLSNKLFMNLRNIENLKKRKMLDTQNKILRFINTGRDFKIRNKYESEVPNIISLNFQIFEVFLNIIQKHPCYLADLLKKMSNKKNIEGIIKLIYGRNQLFLKSKRIISLITGLWNNMFSSEKNFEKNIDDDTSYKLYKMILKNSSNNYQIIREIISDVILLFINELLIHNESEKNADQKDNEMNIKEMYKKIYNTNKKNTIFSKAIIGICKKIPIYFTKNSQGNSNMKEKSFIQYDKNVLWIFRCLILREYSKHNNKGYKESDAFFDYDFKIFNDFIINNNDKTQPRIKKYFNNYLFFPFVELLRDVIFFNVDADTIEINLLNKEIILTLEKMKRKYLKIYNLYKQDKNNFKKHYLNDILDPDTLILKDILKIFTDLSNSNFENNNEENCKNLEKMNDEFSSNLKYFSFDLTLDCVREDIKTAVEKGNEKILVPLNCEELITLQSNFTNFSKQKLFDKKDPLKNILDIMNDFKIGELDNISTIRNFVFNFTLKPLTYVFDYSDDEKILRCEKCLIPLNQKFIEEINIEDVIYGYDWKCNVNNEDGEYQDEEKNDCTDHKKFDNYCMNRNRYKKKEDILNKHNLFKKFYKHNRDDSLSYYEEILYFLPRLNMVDDFLIVLEREKENSKKNKETEWKARRIDEFIRIISFKTSNHNNNKEMLLKINELNDDLEKAYELRRIHREYLKEIKDLNEYLDNSITTIKSNMVFFEKDTDEYSSYLKRGYSNDFFRDKGEKTNVIKLFENKMKNQQLNKNEFKTYKYNLSYLINQKIVNEMITDQDGPASKNSVIFMQKSFIIFYKKENGYKVKLYYKDENRKYIFCGTETKEFMIDEFSLEDELIYELRNNAKMNPSFTIGDMRFNVFYLIHKINSFENLNN